MTNDSHGFAASSLAKVLLCNRIDVDDLPEHPIRWSFDTSAIGTLGDSLSQWNIENLLHESPTSSIRYQRDERTHVERVPRDIARASYEAGLPVVIDRLPAFRPICESIARELDIDSRDVTCGIFASDKGATAPLHFDQAFSIAFQIIGRKKWLLRKNDVAESPLVGWALGDKVNDEHRIFSGNPFPTEMPDDCTTEIASPGDALLIPSGYWHATEALERSVSFNIHIALPIPADVYLSFMRRVLCQKRVWRQGMSRRRIEKNMERLASEFESEAGRAMRSVIVGNRGQRDGQTSNDPRSPYRINPAATISVDHAESGACTVHVPSIHGTRRVELDLDPSLINACRRLRNNANDAVSAEYLFHSIPTVSLEDIGHLLCILARAGFLHHVE